MKRDFRDFVALFQGFHQKTNLKGIARKAISLQILMHILVDLFSYRSVPCCPISNRKIKHNEIYEKIPDNT
ncbi:hypothetical protein SDC9_160164 [bioreactor metagenome]|uniref:Uncharacterized protein n=1 Tax=bioreactor metagenome TaxID=1076179 RepID=A0A645FK95_9ZZZZ